MFCGPFSGPRVIDGKGWDSWDLTSDSDDGFTQPSKPLNLVITDEKGQSDDRIYPFSYEKVIK